MTFVNSSNMAPYILDLPRIGERVVELGDVDSEKFRSYAETARPPMRWIYRREWRLVRRLERRVALECDHSVLVTEAEAALLRAQVPEAADRITGISCGVDHRYFDPALDYPAPFDPAPPTFVFTGTMDYPPNIDAVVWFATAVLPLLRRALPARAVFYRWRQPGRAGKTPREAGRGHRHRARARCPAVRVSRHRRGCADADRARHSEQGAGGDGHG